jgi:UrcA family protein
MSTSIRLKQSSAWVALLALASASGGGNPNDAEDALGARVSYEDLNVNTLAGASILYHRIERAAQQVCGAENDWAAGVPAAGIPVAGVPVPNGEWKTCYRMAIAAAVAKVDSPWLKAIHDSKTGGSKLAALRNARSRI